MFILAILGVIAGLCTIVSLYLAITDSYERKEGLKGSFAFFVLTAILLGAAYSLSAEAQWANFIYQWRVILGIISLILGLLSAIASVFIVLPEHSPERSKGILSCIALVVLTAALWGLASYLWNPALVILLIILGIASLLGAVIAFIFAFDNSNSKQFLSGLTGAGSLVLSVFLWICVAAYFRGIETLAMIPEFFAIIVALAVSIPWTIWLATVVSTLTLTLIFKFGLSLIDDSTGSSGSEIDRSHSWTDYLGRSYGHATRQEVYDHYHGRGSWYAMIRLWLVIGRLAVILLPAAIPLGVIQLIGWHDFFHADGILLSVVLVIVSTAGTFFRLR